VPPTPTPNALPTPPSSAIGAFLKGVAFDSARNLVYIAVQSDGTVAIVDGTTYSLIGKVSAGGTEPNGLALSGDGSKLFVANSGSDNVAVLDANAGYALVGSIGVGHQPFGIAIAGSVGYVTNSGNGTVTLFDVDSLGVIRTLWVGHRPLLPAAVGNRAYVPIHSAFGRWQARDPGAEWDYVQRNKGTDTGVAIVYGDGRGNPVERTLHEYVGFFAAAVDEAHGRVYVTKRDGTAEGLYVLDMNNHSLIQFVPMLRPYSVAVNPENQHVFVVQGEMDEVYVLDGGNGHRLIGAINTTPNNGDVAGMHGGIGIDVNGPAVVVANYASGTLTTFGDGQAGYLGVPIDVEYIRGWQESGGNHGPLGSPVAPAFAYWYSEQQYERGSMHFRQVLSGPNQIYVFDNGSAQSGGTDWFGRDAGTWDQFDDGWSPGMPLFPEACPEAGWPYGPMFGFGFAWCTQTASRGAVKAAIGSPIGWEYGTIGGDQRFANGQVFWNPAADAYYVLRNDDHTWRYYRAHRRYDTGEIEPNITGRISLQGRANNQGAILTSTTGPHTTTDENGGFGLYYEGQMDLYIRHPGYLDVLTTIKGTPGAGLNVGKIQMLGGDVNGDNRIDILDISFVGYRFASTDARADLNDDGVVDILDLSMVGANFGQAGPVRWPR
jgi:YVTN family beta-propeller protein